MGGYSRYASPRDLMEQALGSERGIRVLFENEAQAVSMRNRCASVKTIERKESKKIWSPTDVGYNTCSYDSLTFFIKRKGEDTAECWLYINPQHCPNEGRVVELL